MEVSSGFLISSFLVSLSFLRLHDYLLFPHIHLIGLLLSSVYFPIYIFASSDLVVGQELNYKKVLNNIHSFSIIMFSSLICLFSY